MKSVQTRSRSAVLEWEWIADNKIYFEPSSIIKIVLARGFGTSKKLFNAFVAQYEGKVVDLLENSSGFDLKDKKGTVIPARIGITLSQTAGSVDNIKELLERIDGDVARLSSTDVMVTTVLTLGQVLKLTKTIMDQFSNVHPIIKASWTVVSSVYEAVQDTNLQDESIQDLANSLRELLSTANTTPDLPVIQNTVNVIEEISRQSLQVASLIHEYTTLSFTQRTVKTQVSSDLKKRIEGCQKRCAALKERLYDRLHLDTNILVKGVKAGQDQSGRKLQTIVDQQLADKINSWISPPDSSNNLYEADEKRQENSCNWFLRGKRFREWKKSPGFLWVKGKAGSGKSVLSSAIINELSEKEPSWGVAYFFFDGRDSQDAQQLHHKLLRSLIAQFSHQLDGTPAELANLYKHCGDNQQPSVKDLQATLRDILTHFPHAYIVIDALDECTDRSRTLSWVSDLTSGTAENVHILVTSRPELDIIIEFERLDPRPIDMSLANRDIISYVKQHMDSKFKMYSKRTCQTIESTLVNCAEGSFRWVALQITELGNCSSEYQIHQQLQNLPDGLNEMYGRILKNVDEKYSADTRTFLQWLAFCQRPMKIEEVADAITVDFDLKDGPAFIPARRYTSPRDVLKRCSSLVSESEGWIKLSHFSVKEYLLHHVEEYFRLDKETSHSKISEISVIYLLQFDSWDPLTEDVLHSSPLAEYAAEYWIHHAKSGGTNQTLLTSILRLFTPKSAAFANWVHIYNIDRLEQRFPSINMVQLPNPLYYSALAGLELVSQHLVTNNVDVNAQGGNYGTALGAASFKGHKAIVELLLENKAEVNAHWGSGYGTALLAASYEGHKSIVELLLKNKAEVNVKGPHGSTALSAASYAGHKGIVKLLLANKADVNAPGGEYHGTALSEASCGGQKAIVELLLKNKAEVNARGGLYDTALIAASDRGCTSIVELLLESKADANMQGGLYGTALGAASFEGHKAVVKLLLNNKADVNAQGGKYNTALIAAAYEGHKAVVDVLLKNKADVNAQSGEYGTALTAASSEGHTAIVKLLLDNKADVNARGGKYDTALIAASSAGDTSIVKLLLESGVEVNAQGEEYGTALTAASSGGHKSVVELLLDNKAEVNALGEDCVTALWGASYGGHNAVIELLLANGAEVNIHGDFGTALFVASFEGYLATVKLLLANNAEVNAQGGRPLYGAALGGHEEVVELLLDNGADVNMQGEFYGWALRAASSEGHEDVVKLLLQHGADVNGHQGPYGNALQTAEYSWHEVVMTLLMENGALWDFAEL